MRRPMWSLFGVLMALGVLGAMLAPASADEDEGEKNKKEEKVTIEQVPGVVKATILKEAGENKIKEIEKVTKGDVVHFEAEWVVGDKKVEIKVASDGKLLSKKTKAVDEDDDEDEDEDDGGED